MSGPVRSTMAFAIAFLLLVCAMPASAQLDTGSIQGTVVDATGAVIQGASVKITNTRTGRAWELTTGPQGDYTSPPLPSGPYSIEVVAAGFRTGLVSELVLYANERRRADLQMEIGMAAEQVTVEALRGTVNTTTSDLGATIDTNRVTNLPLNGRDFTALITLVPGAVVTGGFGQTSLGGFETSLAGVNVLLDGADATRIDINATSTQLGRQESRVSRASLDSIQEFRVLQSTYSAEYGRSVGDVINVITKSGGNTLHGSLFEFFRHNKMDARNYFALREEPLRLHQFGGNLSGPLATDRLFFFVNYEGVRQRVSTPVQAQVLSSFYRAMADPSILPVLNAVPLGNGGVAISDGLGNPVREFFNGSLRNTLREDTGSVKVDWNASQRDAFSFRYNIADSFTSTQYGVAAGQVSPSTSRNHLLKGTWTRTFSGSLLNEFGLAFNRPQTDSLGGGGDFDTLFQCFFCDDSAGDFTMGTLPGPALFSSRRPQYSFQVLNTTSWIKGRHSTRFGLDIRRAHTQDELQPQRFMSYAGVDWLIANVAFQISTLGYNQIEVANTNYSFFFQDDIRVARNLTVNLGLRYDYNSVLKSSQIANFDIATLTVLSTGDSLYRPDRNNFGPRIGFAYDPFNTGKTVLRGGYGIFFNPLLTGAALSLAGNNQPGFNMNIFDDIFGVRVCDPALTWAWPLPAQLPTCTPPAPRSVNALDRDMRDSYSHHWSFGLQQELFPSTVLEISYVGNKGVNLPAGASGAGLELNFEPFFGTTRLSPDFANIRRLGNFLGSRYDALQVSARRRVGKGFNIDANYTWAHQFDNVVNIFSAFQNSLDPDGDWSEGDIDVRHNFTLGMVYDVPAAGFLPPKLGRGWQVSSIIQTRTGLPVNVTMSAPFLGIDLIRPNIVPGVNPYSGDWATGGFNAAAFTAPGFLEYGNTPRNYLRGPAFNQVDVALSKTTALNERVGLQLRAEMFNLLNKPNFVNPVGIVTDINFGRSLSTIGNRVGTGTARQAQLGVKVVF